MKAAPRSSVAIVCGQRDAATAAVSADEREPGQMKAWARPQRRSSSSSTEQKSAFGLGSDENGDAASGAAAGRSETKLRIFERTSSRSAAAFEPRTIPAPAYTSASSPRSSAERIATQSSDPAEPRYPNGPA